LAEAHENTADHKWEETMLGKPLAGAAIAVAALAGTAQAADLVKFGSIRVPVQIFVGIDKGFFADEDIQVEPVFFKSGAEIARDLHEAFHAGGVAGIAESAGFIREILSSATLFRKEDGTGVVVEVKGYLNGLLTADANGESRNKFVVGNAGSGGGIRTPDTRIMIPLL
jgi:ABC-type nitrate/sulfonate/bicarbonate transport system substrate-binding protein